ncbi:MAG: RDD family protein [Gammaproteobacteria bacterium]|nr:RDD family protein [Gammaproteobacteria bacterium]
MKNVLLLLRRLGAIAYDLMIIMAILIVATAPTLFLTRGEAVLAGTTWFQIYIALIILTYFVVSWWRRGQTIGMIAWRLRLQSIHSPKPSFMRCVFRALAALLSLLALGLGFLWILFDRQGRALHDLLSGTVLEFELRPNAPASMPPE